MNLYLSDLEMTAIREALDAHDDDLEATLKTLGIDVPAYRAADQLKREGVLHDDLLIADWWDSMSLNDWKEEEGEEE